MSLVWRLFVCILTLVGCVQCTKKSKLLSNRVILEVNNEKMTAREFADLLADRLKPFDALAAKDQSVLSRTKQEVVRDFIVKVLTEQWAHESGIFVRAEELEGAINSVRASYPDDLTFQKALADEGLTFKAWREKVEYSVLQKLVNAKLKEKITAPTDTEIDNYYKGNKDDFISPEAVRLRQTVLADENDAKRIEEELKTGKKLEDLARKFSVTPDALQGGDLGWIEKGTSEVFDKAFNMKVGQRSEVIKSPYGYHIFEVLGRRPSQTKTLTESSAKIRRLLQEKREQGAYSAWLEAQLRRSKVLKDEEFINNIKVETKE